MTTPQVRSTAADVILALRQLGLAIAAARPDGMDVLKRLRAGNLRIVFDERLGVLLFVIADEHDNIREWIETVAADPNHEQTFGALMSQVSMGVRTLH